MKLLILMKVSALSGVLAVSAGALAQGDGQAVAMGAGRMVQGTVTAVAADHLTMKTQAGETYNVAITPNTQVRKGRDQVKIAQVHAGDGVGAMGEVDAPNKTVHAMFLMVMDAEQLKKAREAMGKTFIAGKITVIDELKLTILRADGVSQTIAVDEDTSFRKGGRGMMMAMGGGAPGGGARQGGGAGGGGAGGGGGEAITLADVKVGDAVAGPGALKGGVFVPTQLIVGDPEAAGGGRRRHQQNGAGVPPSAEPKQ